MRHMRDLEISLPRWKKCNARFHVRYSEAHGSSAKAWEWFRDYSIEDMADAMTSLCARIDKRRLEERREGNWRDRVLHSVRRGPASSGMGHICGGDG